jgi:hypothetical protein
MDGKDYIASVVAATSTAEARGEPTATIPAPPSPSPRSGEIQLALTVTPEAAFTAAAATAKANETTSAGNSPSINPATTTIQSTVTATDKGSTAKSMGGPATQVAVAQTDPTFTQVSEINTPTSSDSAITTKSPDNSSNLLVSILLAVFGVVCLVLFWKFRFRIYPLFGIEASQPDRCKDKKAKNPDHRTKPPQNRQPIQADKPAVGNELNEEDEGSEAEK